MTPKENRPAGNRAAITNTFAATQFTAHERLVDAVRDQGRDVKDTGHGRAQAQCPAHDDRHSSLSIGPRKDGKGVVVHCHAGCSTQDVVSAVGLSMRDLFDNDDLRHVYNPRREYKYPDGRVVYRKPDKSFPQSGNTQGHTLFHADRITADTTTVYIPEGEKDVEAIEAVGGVAVCSAMGAGKAAQFDWSPLHGKHAIVVADKDDAGRKHACQVVELLRGIAASVRIVEAAEGKDAADHIAGGKALDELVSVEQAPQIVMATTRLADVQPERVSWLWPGRIPVGKLVTLDGDPGLGKSTLALAFAATITTGATWPDGSVCEHTGAVLLMSAEDGLADTIRPRLDAAGADVTNVHAADGVPIDADGTLRPPTLADVLALDEAISRTGARLLVIDVVMAYLPDGIDSHKDQDIRRVLSRLAALADRTGCTVLLLRHLNKTGGRDPLYRGGGSIGIVGAARAGLLVAPDPDDTDRRVLASVKSNLGPAPDSLAYRLVGEGEFGVARVQWEGATTHTASALLAPPDDADDRREVDSWLRDYLEAEGRANAGDVIRDSKLAGFSENQVKKARRSIGAASIRHGFGKGSTVIWSIGAIGATDAGHKNRESMAPMGPSTPMATDSPRPAAEPAPGMTDRVKLALANANARLRRPGCLCVDQPKPCYYCVLASGQDGAA
jgi:putative DNA primase/helicase